MTRQHPTVQRQHSAAPDCVAAGVAALLAACAPGGDERERRRAPRPAAEVETDIAAVGDVTLTVWDQEVRGGQDKPLEAAQRRLHGEVPQRHDRARVAVLRPTCRSRCGSRSAGTTPPTSSRPTTAAPTWAPSSRPGCCVPRRLRRGVRLGRALPRDGAVAGVVHRGRRDLRRGQPVRPSADRRDGRRSGTTRPSSRSSASSRRRPSRTSRRRCRRPRTAGEIPIQFGNLDQWPGIHEFGFVQNQFVPPRRHPRPRLRPAEGASWTSPTRTSRRPRR